MASMRGWARAVVTCMLCPARRIAGTALGSPAVRRGWPRLLAAIPLLRTASVSEVSRRVGYASPTAFTAAFTRAFGVPSSRFTPSRLGKAA
ncbi:helix-turn-helix domain-containing protein [Streptomyces sp. NPDC058471]|uniref:helix-turn-helix domain-containing protein n=1 Tax=Streptomyces sp. NPDC058471 TaxID=3346516 RepID=UPI0036548321